MTSHGTAQALHEPMQASCALRPAPATTLQRCCSNGRGERLRLLQLWGLAHSACMQR